MPIDNSQAEWDREKSRQWHQAEARRDEERAANQEASARHQAHLDVLAQYSRDNVKLAQDSANASFEALRRSRNGSVTFTPNDNPVNSPEYPSRSTGIVIPSVLSAVFAFSFYLFATWFLDSFGHGAAYPSIIIYSLIGASACLAASTFAIYYGYGGWGMLSMTVLAVVLWFTRGLAADTMSPLGDQVDTLLHSPTAPINVPPNYFGRPQKAKHVRRRPPTQSKFKDSLKLNHKSE